MSRWVLRTVEVDPPVYLVDYRKPMPDLTAWSEDVTRAETFFSALDALEMARRISHLLVIPVEAVSHPGWDGGDEPDLATARYDARDRLCAALMTADLTDEDDYDEVERELARAFLTTPAVIRSMKKETPE